jgi:SET domain-containing protein
MDDLIYARFINEYIGYGVFAKQFIKSDTIIGEICGKIEPVNDDSLYTWTYKTSFKGYSKLGINGRYYGNILKYVNDNNIHNVTPIYSVRENVWIVLYVALKDI